MTKKRYTKPQIRTILHEYENGFSIQQILEKYKISQATFYNWKSKFGQDMSRYSQELSRLREDNEKLKKMFADISLENMSLKSKLSKLTES